MLPTDNERAPRLRASPGYGGADYRLKDCKVIEAAAGRPFWSAADITSGGMGASVPIVNSDEVNFHGKSFFSNLG
jgi:hypothetical protein